MSCGCSTPLTHSRRSFFFFFLLRGFWCGVPRLNCVESAKYRAARTFIIQGDELRVHSPCFYYSYSISTQEKEELERERERIRDGSCNMWLTDCVVHWTNFSSQVSNITAFCCCARPTNGRTGEQANEQANNNNNEVQCVRGIKFKSKKNEKERKKNWKTERRNPKKWTWFNLKPKKGETKLTKTKYEILMWSNILHKKTVAETSLKEERRFHSPVQTKITKLQSF